MDHDAHVIRDDAHALPHRWPPRRLAEIEDAMLLGHARHEYLGMLDELAESLTRHAANRLAAERLGPGVDDRLTGHRRRDYRGEHGERAIIPFAGADRRRGAIVVDVSTGPELGDARDLMRAPERRRGTAAYDRGTPSGGRELL